MHTKLGLRLCFGVLLALSACGGDDDKSDSNGSAEGGAGGRGGAGGSKSSAAGSGSGTGSGKEGSECNSDKDCDSDLSCLNADADVADLKVCARHCSKASDCDDGELCKSVDNGNPEQALCWKVVGEALKPCGPAFTSVCDDEKKLGCLRVESESGSVAGGVCLTPCSMKEKDTCESGFSCLDIIDDPDMGLCVKTAKRGETCDEPNGKFCEDSNLCLGDEGDWRCYQDCTDSMKCDDDKECTKLGDAAYCE